MAEPGLLRWPRKLLGGEIRPEGSNPSLFANIYAAIAQLVERDVANVEVAGSTPAGRSKFLHV